MFGKQISFYERKAVDELNTPEINTEAWVDRYGDMLFRFAMARVGNRQVAEDLVQETFLPALRAKGRFKGQATEKTLGCLPSSNTSLCFW
jgi:DNA-directed RNA polymerase specialized sigma24 family protein